MAKILVVDDDEIVLELLKDFIGGLGHEVYTAPDPVSFLARVKLISPDIVIMDLQMPAGGADVAVAALQASESLRGIPLLFCTSIPLEEARRRFPESPLRRYASKPIDFPSFVEKLDILLVEAGRLKAGPKP
ncbi:MAG: response regulator [Elusimicrobia bacterium]|nr:response regulator [Elusimicrobiota bacterium]MDE2424904.1 response regulator [Elusimicrobiota bacterium]